MARRSRERKRRGKGRFTKSITRRRFLNPITGIEKHRVIRFKQLRKYFVQTCCNILNFIPL